MSVWRIAVIGSTLASLGACATIPNVTLNYYFPRAETRLTVTRTIGCSAKDFKDAKGNPVPRMIRSAITIAPTTAYSADLDWRESDAASLEKPENKRPIKQGHLWYKGLGGTFTDGDAAVTLTADGRLSAINASSVGEGSAIIKDVVTIAATAATVGALGFVTGQPTADPNQPEIDAACNAVDTFAAAPVDPTAKSPPSLVSLTYSLPVFYDVPTGGTPQFLVDQASSSDYTSFTEPSSTIALVADPASDPADKAITKAFAKVGEWMKIALEMRTPADDVRYLETTSRDDATDKTKILLDLTKVAMINVAVTGHAGDMEKERDIWLATIPVPTHQLYQLPVPSPATFGKTAFGLTLSDSGTIQALHYGSNSAAPGVLDSVSGALTALQQGDTQRASDLKAKADVIAQQQRLVACELSPTTCK